MGGVEAPVGYDVYWVDEVGARLESGGVEPGRIFEFSSRIATRVLPGGVVVTNDHVAPGEVPRSWRDVSRVIVRDAVMREDIEMPGNRAVVVARFACIADELC